MNNAMKKLTNSTIQAIVDKSPWTVREALLEACFRRFGPGEVSARLMPQLGIAEVGVWGNLGLIRSAWNDRQILGTYAKTGTAEGGIVGEILEFFGRQNGTYIDVGANIGLTVIPFARIPTIRCIAFEPEPGNFRFLKLNVAANVENDTVEFHQSAVFSRFDSLSLAIADGNLGDHRLTIKGVPGRQTVEVPAVPLDSVVERITGRLAIKIDTQGAEPSVIQGGTQVLRRAGMIAMEFCPYLMRQLGGDPETVIQCLEGFDQVAVLEPGTEAAPVYGSPATAQNMLRAKARTARQSDGDYFDIIAKRDG